MPPILTIFKLNSPYFDREFEYKHSKIISSSNKNIQNGKWNVINVSSKKKSFVEEGSQRQEIYVYILLAKRMKRKSQTNIPELVKATRSFTAVDTSTVNAELENLLREKEDRVLYTINAVLVNHLVLRRKWRNMHIATEHKLQSQCSFLHTSINSWKRRFNKQNKDFLPLIFSKRGRPNLVRDDLLQR